jgi:asparagine synthase (glutamine-hydrolysing)
MPGIAGFFAKSAHLDRTPLLSRMLEVMKHDASYTVHRFQAADAGHEIGITSRDSLRHVSWNPDHTLGLLVYGEFRTDQLSVGARKEAALEKVLLDYQKHGIRAFLPLNGWFSGVLLDLPRREVVLFNDRYGLGRVYCHQNSEGFFFSSEAKSILAVLPETRVFDEQSLGEWLSCGCVLQNRTLFRNIKLLPPGAAWKFSAEGTVKRESHFCSEEWENQPKLSAEDYFQKLKSMFAPIVAAHSEGGKTAMSLTGGLDGRMIMAWARLQPGTLPCYTFNGPIRDCADVTIARTIARACGQPHQDLRFEPDFFSHFLKLAEEGVWITDGAMDVTGAAELYMNRKARQIAPVRLTGNYGSEILRRYVAFRPRSISSSLFTAECVRSSKLAAETYAEESKGNPLSFIAFKQVPWHHHSRFSIEQSQLNLRSPYLDNQLVSLVFRAPRESATSIEVLLRLIAEGNPQLARIPTDRGITYPAGKATNRIIRHYHEFMAKAEYAYDYGMPDWLARVDRCFSPLHIERFFLGRQKFCHFRSWYRTELSNDLRDILLTPASRGRSYLDGAAIEPLVTGHIKGQHNRTVDIHKLLSLELIQRSLLSGSRYSGSAPTAPVAAVATA